MIPTVRVVESVDNLARAGAAEFLECARDAEQARGRFVVALSGGSTPRRLYELLAREPFRRQIPWASVEFFWGDERTVPPDHPDSNFRMAKEVLLAPLGISPARIHRIEAERPDRDAAARAYETELARVLGEPPRLDLVLLGLGADGHTASIFPQTPAVRERVRWVVAHHVPALGADRITLTAPIINQAACVVFLVAGAEKATAVARVLHGPREPDLLPAQLIAPEHGRLLWLLEREAARLLQREAVE